MARPVPLEDQIAAIKFQIIQRNRIAEGYRRRKATHEAEKAEEQIRIYEAILISLTVLKDRAKKRGRPPTKSQLELPLEPQD